MHKFLFLQPLLSSKCIPQNLMCVNFPENPTWLPSGFNHFSFNSSGYSHIAKHMSILENFFKFCFAPRITSVSLTTVFLCACVL